MNTGIVMIGLALILLSIAMMVTPAAAIAAPTVTTGGNSTGDLIGEPFYIASYRESASTTTPDSDRPKNFPTIPSDIREPGYIPPYS